MREDFKLLGSLLAAFQSTTALALPPTTPGSLDPTLGGTGAVFRKFVAGGVNEQITKVRLRGEKYVVAGSTTVQNAPVGFIGVVDKAGNPDTTFNGTGVVTVPGTRITGLEVLPDRIVASGGFNNNALLLVVDVDFGKPIIGCGNAEGKVFFSPRILASSTFTGLFNAGVDNQVGGVYVESNAQQNDFRGGAVLVDARLCKEVDVFGINGRAMAQGDFYATFGSWHPGRGGLIGGVTQLPGSPNLSEAVFNFDTQGNPGNCGALVKSIFSVSGQNVTPNAGVFDPATDTEIITAYTSNAVPVIRQLQLSNCTLNGNIFNISGNAIPTSVDLGPGINNSAYTVIVGNYDFSGSPYNARVSFFNPTGGAPVLTSQSVNLVPGPVDNAALVSAHPKAGSLTSSAGLSLVIQPDAKIVFAGTANPNGGSSLVTRYIGVERTGNVIEFYNNILNHYFITADPNEAAAIDAGSAGPGWSHTGQTWKSGGPDRVCRFYGSPDINPATGSRRGPNSHFYTIVADECGAVKLDPGWRFESYDFSGWPIAGGGTCPAGTIAVKRVYNGRFAQNDSNHRYTISDTIYNQMIASGWRGEGIVFCSVA